jgi:hypothetical protein
VKRLVEPVLVVAAVGLGFYLAVRAMKRPYVAPHPDAKAPVRLAPVDGTARPGSKPGSVTALPPLKVTRPGKPPKRGPAKVPPPDAR